MVKYGLLVHSTENLGDDIQSLAAKQFLPRVDILIDRDYPNRVNSKESVKVIMNGWFTHKPENWPPSSKIDPLFISFHISDKIANKMLRPRVVEYLKNFRVGCRDLWTKELLEGKGIDAYFSGCLTLTLDYGYRKFKNQKENSGNILICDLDPRALAFIPPDILVYAKFVSNEIFAPFPKYFPNFLRYLGKKIRQSNLGREISDKILYTVNYLKAKRFSVQKRLQLAEERIRDVATARLVITSRLHIALPALAFGTSVLFVNDNLNDVRFRGLIKFLNAYTVNEFKNKIGEIDLEKPPKNPNQAELIRLKSNLIKAVERFVGEVNESNHCKN